MRLNVVLAPNDKGGYTVYVPSLPGCLSTGDTKEEALEYIGDAIDFYLEAIEEKPDLSENAEQIEVEV
ncbi:putative RNase H-like HicB family nuclease [Methanofollis sp. W23]|uniref:type II toxin-antitoxin system HicB family antitoxin n=1 Tax=Methanofollis sp. W23 TaxID=2817849 RepID=UPI001AE7EC12|nr:type II toxin-antitoxin system HicB family antitoxin [Methanofollis sp. W23]MBP2146231.1 putative RNase H-like HicB family nuclease [Methanofollis sp. W23]